MDRILGNLQRIENGEKKELSIFAYVDDILLSSETMEEHEEDLKTLLQRLDEYGLTINVRKCQFFKEELTFLGHLITPQGSKPVPEKVEAITNLKPPKTLGSLKSFLGMTHFYNKYIKNAAEIMRPMNNMMKGYTKAKRNIGINWNENEEALLAFENTKQALADATLLAYPAANGDLAVFCDASIQSAGGSINQFQNGAYRPLGFYSKEFTEKEKNGSTFLRELTAIFKTVKYFRHLLQGNFFTIFTDHQPLIRAYEKPLDREIQKKLGC